MQECRMIVSAGMRRGLDGAKFECRPCSLRSRRALPPSLPTKDHPEKKGQQEKERASLPDQTSGQSSRPHTPKPTPPNTKMASTSQAYSEADTYDLEGEIDYSDIEEK